MSAPTDKAEPSTSSATSPSADETAVASGGGGWGIWGWVESAKSKSKEVLEAVKKDLDELSTVVKEEAQAASEVFGLNQSDSTVGVMKKSFSTFLGQMTEVLVPPMEDEEAEPVMITKDGLVALTGFAKHLAELQANDATYLNEPDSTLASQYQRWLEVVEQDQFTEQRLTKQLTTSQILNEKYLNLVPTKVAHMDFWKRYLFKKALLEDAVANAEAATKKAEQEAASTETVTPDKIIVQTEQPKPTTEAEELKMWEADLGVQNIELSEEEQARLLEEYEREIKEREGKTVEVVKEPKKTGATKKQTQQQSNSNQTANKGKQQPQQNNSKTNKSGQSGKAAKGKNNKQQVQPTEPVAKLEKKEEQSSASDESWEKDFDDVGPK